MKRKTKSKTLKRSYCLIEKPGSVLRRKVRLKQTQKIHANRICQTQSKLTTVTPIAIKCPKCNLVFHSNSEWNLKRHLQLHLPTTKRYECSVCSRSYSTEYNFRKHLPRRHQNEDVSTITWKIINANTRVRPTFSENYV